MEGSPGNWFQDFQRLTGKSELVVVRKPQVSFLLDEIKKKKKKAKDNSQVKNGYLKRCLSILRWWEVWIRGGRGHITKVLTGC